MNLPSAKPTLHATDPPRRIGPLLKTISIVGALLLAACVTQRPVLYPNAHLNSVGKITAQQDIDQCMQLADDYTNTSLEKRIAKSTAGGATVGGAAGAATGGVWGSPGRGAAAGAAGGAAAAMTRSILSSGDPQPVYRRFVEKCLQDKGYEPIGWD